MFKWKSNITQKSTAVLFICIISETHVQVYTCAYKYMRTCIKWKTENIAHWINNLFRQQTTSVLNLGGTQKNKTDALLPERKTQT
jgi:hypothetical protein